MNLIKIVSCEKYDLLTLSDLMNVSDVSDVSDVLLCKKSNITITFKKEKYFNLFNWTSPYVTSDQISLLVPN